MNTHDENNLNLNEDIKNYSENTINYSEGTNEVTNTRKENVLFGVIGALLGSLIGVAAWIIIYNLGYLASISGIIMFACSIKGYEILAGGLSKKGIIITVIINIIMVYVSMHLSLGFEIYDVYKLDYDVTIFDCIRSVPSFISDYDDVRSTFLSNLGFGYLFTLLGVFSTVRNMLSNNK